jgi:hypothetical protein
MPLGVPPSSKRVLIAVAISIGLHSMAALGWLCFHERSTSIANGIPTEVDAPDDREFVINLRDPLDLRPAPVTRVMPILKPDPPRSLPTEIQVPDAVTPVAGAVSGGNSPNPPRSSPNSVSASPLHGKLKPGRSIVYVLDRSASMGPDGMLRKACDAISSSLEQLSPECRFQIVAYNGSASPFQVGLLPATADHRARAERWLNGLQAEGSSNHLSGFREAIWLRPDAIFMLTDADDLDEKEVRTIRALWRQPVFLTMAVFGSSRPRTGSAFENLARSTGGDVAYVGR